MKLKSLPPSAGVLIALLCLLLNSLAGKLIAQTVAPPDSIVVELTRGEAASNFTLPAKMVVKSFSGPLSFFIGSNGKVERGSPYYSGQVETGATFYAITGLIQGFPARISGPFINRTGGSSFIAIKQDEEGNKKIWLNISVGAWRINGGSGIISDWEYQFRYFEDTKLGTKTATLGLVPNADFYAGQNVESSVTLYPNDDLTLFIYNQLKDKNDKPISQEKFLEKIDLNKSLIDNIDTRISADGSKSTLLKIEGENLNEYTFKIKENDAEKYGSLGKPSIKDKTLEIIYTHPAYFAGDKNSKEYKVNLEIIRKNIPKSTLTIRIVRPPFLMVHGLNSQPGIYEKMKSALIGSNRYNDKQLHAANYEPTNRISFIDNREVVPKEINHLLKQCLSIKISAGKVDIIGHSMGGILSRIYLQSNQYKNNINKLITLNTPHSGSQLANLGFNLNYSFIGTVVNSFVSDTDLLFENGAIDDLRVNSFATINLLNGSNKNRNIVPSHAIVTHFAIPVEEPQPLSSITNWASVILKAAVYQYKALKQPTINTTSILLNNLIFDLYNDLNDVVVADLSQRGGLPPSNVTVIKGNQDHSSTENDEVIQATLNLLDESPKGTKFSKTGFDPFKLDVPSFLKDDNKRIMAMSASVVSSITITQPVKGAIVSPGQILTIKVNGSNDIENITLFAGNSKVGIYGNFQKGPSAEFSYTIPKDAIGKINIVGVGYNEQGYAAMDTTVFIMVEPKAAIKGISVYPNFLTIPQNGYQGISIIGQYEDGVQRDITELPGIQYSFRNDFATHKGSGKITGYQVGEDSLTIQYQGISVKIPIEVYESDTPDKQNQSITFAPISNKTFGESDFDLSASTSSGLPVSYDFTSNPADIISITGNTVKILGAGTVTVTASQAGNDEYNAAPDIQRTFTIEKASQTITFDALTPIEVGDLPVTVCASASSDLPVSLSLSKTPADIVTLDPITDSPGCYLLTVTGVGKLTIVASQKGNENYTAAPDVIRSTTITEPDPVDKTAPVITDLTPQDNATDISVDTDLEITFNESIVKGSGQIKFYQEGSLVQIIEVQSNAVAVNMNKVTIDPNQDFPSGSNIYVQITQGAFTDIAGNAFTGISDNTAWNFITSNPVDENAPLIVTLSPVSNATQVNVDANLMITFDEEVQATDKKIFIYQNNILLEEIFPTSNQVSISSNEVVINPARNFAEGSTIYVLIEPGAFTDLAGNAFAGIWNNNSWSFSTLTPYDTQAPTITSFSPANGATNIDVSTNLQVTFDEPIQKGTGNISIYANSILIQTININSPSVILNDNLLTINPVQDFPSESTISVQIKEGLLTDLSENGFAGIQDNTTWNFTTVDLTPPMVTIFSPASNAAEVAINTDLVITFNEAVVKGIGTITINAGTTVQIIDIADAAVTVNGNSVTINPADLPYSSLIAVQISANAFTDEVGNGFAGIMDNTTWNFMTVAPEDVMPPTVTLYSPANNATEVAINTNLVITFDEAVKATDNKISIYQNNLLLEELRANSSPVTITNNQVVINPTNEFDQGATIYILIEQGAFTDLSDNTFAGISNNTTWNFSIAEETLEMQDQTISFDAIADKTEGDAPFTITATASSGLPVSFSLSSVPAGIAKIEGSTITLLGGTGTVTVTASQAGNDEYNAAPAVSRTFTIHPLSNEQAVVSFTLIDADTDKALGPLKDGAILNMPELPTGNLNIRANTNPGVIGSVMISLNGKAVTENKWPYAYAGGSTTDYNAMSLSAGEYTLTATPYQQSGGKGKAGKSLTIHFTVLNQVVESFTLIDANTDQDIMEVKDGDVINLADLTTRKFNIRANTNVDTVGSVVFELNSQKKIENNAPYTYAGNNKADYRGINLPVGDYTLTATPYTGYTPYTYQNGRGYRGKPLTIKFKVINTLTLVRQNFASEEDTKDIKINAYPNPFTTKSTLDFIPPQDSKVQLKVYDTKGLLVAQLFDGNVEAGKVYSIDISADNLQSGVYIIHLTTSNQRSYYKLVLNK